MKIKIFQKLLIALFFITIISSCSKTSTTSSALVGDWIKSSSFNGLSRAGASSFVINNIAYIVGGFGNLGRTEFNDVWAYDNNTGWTAKGVLPFPARHNGIAFATSTKGYYGLGIVTSTSNVYQDFYEYDPIADTWTAKANYPEKVFSAVAFSINDLGYVGTGTNDQQYIIKSFYQYTPATNAWTAINFIGEKRSGAVSFVYNKKGYVCLGINNAVDQIDFLVYDPAVVSPTNNGWSKLNQLANVSTDSFDDFYGDIPRQNAVAFVSGTNAFITTGQNFGQTNSTWMYDFSADRWSQKTNYEGALRSYAVAFTLRDTGYIGLGLNSTSNYLDDLYRFNQSSAPVANN